MQLLYSKLHATMFSMFQKTFFLLSFHQLLSTHEQIPVYVHDRISQDLTKNKKNL